MRTLALVTRWILPASILLLVGLDSARGDEVPFLRWHENVDADRLALGGYDPVAYLQDGRAVRGEDDLEASHEGVRYRFAIDEHRDLFQKDPDRYLPEFGGWCAYSLGVDPKTGAVPLRVKADPRSFQVIDGRTVLFARFPSFDARKTWNQGDPAAHLERARAFWKSRESLAASVGAKPEGLHPMAVLETVQFDFFVGEWDSRYKVRVDPKQPGYSQEIRGTWKAWYGWEGFAIYDDWSQVGGRPGNSGPAIRSFDPVSRKWIMHYIPINAPLSSVWAMTGEFDEKGWLHAEMEASDGRGKFLQRVHFVNISEDHFSWRSDRSYDGGETWIENWGMGENHRVRKTRGT